MIDHSQQTELVQAMLHLVDALNEFNAECSRDDEVDDNTKLRDIICNVPTGYYRISQEYIGSAFELKFVYNTPAHEIVDQDALDSAMQKNAGKAFES